MSEEKLIGVKELAEELDQPVSWVYAQTMSKRIPGFKIGKVWKFRLSEVLAQYRREPTGLPDYQSDSRL